jgi:hydrogenase expression/formation protein HypC
MCIGIPMQLSGCAGTHGIARGRGRTERIDLRLVDACRDGDWVLVFQGAARERLEAARAAEIDAALDLLERGLSDATDAAADPGFALPSAMSRDALVALFGAPPTNVTHEGAAP